MCENIEIRTFSGMKMVRDIPYTTIKKAPEGALAGGY
jgi:hypothetical protein